MRDFEGTKQAKAAPHFIHNWKPAQIFLVDELDRVIDWGGGTHAHHFGLHDVLNPRREVGQQQGGGNPKLFQDKINPLVGVSATGGYDIELPRKFLKFRVTNCCADRIHVRIPVADDEGLHEEGGVYRKSDMRKKR